MFAAAEMLQDAIRGLRFAGHLPSDDLPSDDDKPPADSANIGELLPLPERLLRPAARGDPRAMLPCADSSPTTYSPSKLYVRMRSSRAAAPMATPQRKARTAQTLPAFAHQLCGRRCLSLPMQSKTFEWTVRLLRPQSHLTSAPPARTWRTIVLKMPFLSTGAGRPAATGKRGGRCGRNRPVPDTGEHLATHTV